MRRALRGFGSEWEEIEYNGILCFVFWVRINLR